ncbi:formimidoylglutamase [Clostridium sp.]|uniref:formimidoylglutamase n=1 Tax=Clostridium sp. TaxID=1506 RepID=UPI001A5A6123|nr:formimidoylglutamase [Clostridium sp.]MBK5234337.1 formimidoylglutamase [Clostridium sp.]
MVDVNYKITDKTHWQGRIDSESNFDSFRWHQWVNFIDLREENLIPFKGPLGFAFIGFCCDAGVKRNKGRTGAAKGPESIRKELSNLPCRFTEEVKLFDAGNVFCENISLEESQNLLSKAIEQILSLNLFPIVLGGGHEIAFGHYNGILNYLKQSTTSPNIGIINFDAHFDLRPYPSGGSSGTMFRQIADICRSENLKYSYLCIGVQKHSNTIDLFKTADKLGAEYILAKDIVNSDNLNMFERLDNFIKFQDEIYITICSDVFSSAFAPGVSSSQPLGLDPESVLKFLSYILKSNKVISFDIAEVSPRFDQDEVTANLASVLIFSIVNSLCEIHGLDL